MLPKLCIEDTDTPQYVDKCVSLESIFKTN